MGNESWLTPDIKNSEIFPDCFDADPKDRASDAHGCVFIAFKRDLFCTETMELDTNCEIVWCKSNIIGCRTLYLWSFYRHMTSLIMNILRSLTHPYLRLCRIEMLGDFNCSDIEWSHMQVPHGVQKRQSQQQLLVIIGEHCLTQVVNIPTHNDKALACFLLMPHPL